MINFLITDKHFIGKVFVHEWAHLRYGIFDEYGEAGAGIEGYPLFFRRNGSKTIVPNVCANKAPIYTTLYVQCILKFTIIFY
jgi:hypothetical protein